MLQPRIRPTRTAATVYGVLSLIVWSLILIVSVKYILVIMRLHNRGEGGILALLALLRQKRHHGALIVLGLFGTALLYGDGIITPAISVLSAAEGSTSPRPRSNTTSCRSRCWSSSSCSSASATAPGARAACSVQSCSAGS